MPMVERKGRARIGRTIRIALAVIACCIFMIPVFWMGVTALKPRDSIVTVPPSLVFKPGLDGFVRLFGEMSTLSKTEIEVYKQRTDLNWMEQIALARGQKIIGQSQFVGRLLNSLIIAGGSTIVAVLLGTLAAYAFSRFRLPGQSDLLFFILSTRMLPAVVVTIPIFLMYRRVGLYDTHIGMILLYTAFNLSFSVWLLKGFMDDIPREYEEAALVDGYSRWQAFIRLVLPQAVTGIATAAVFCLMFAWNEFAFALMLTSDRARTAPPSLTSIVGTGQREWGATAAGVLLFLLPVLVITFLMRKYLLRGITFGAIRK